jgi:hypothetical protein
MEVISLSKMMRLTLPKSLSEIGCCAAAIAAVLALCPLPHARAQEAPPPPQGVSRGENFSAKPPAQLFASDCTGAGCHKGPQGLGKKANGIGGLSGFLREHYTNSRESAAALANYLSGQPSGPAPKEPKEARTPKPGKPATAAAPASGSPNWFEGTPVEGKPSPNEPHKPREAAHTPPGRGPHTAGKPEPGAKPETEEKREEQPAAIARQHPDSAEQPSEPAAKPVEPAAKPAEAAVRPARAARGRHPAAAANAAAPAAAPEPESAPAPSPPPAPKQYDIFD